MTIKTEQISKDYSCDFVMSAFSSTGAQKWSRVWSGLPLTELVTASEYTIYNDRIYIGISGTLYCLDYLTGKDLWSLAGVGTFSYAPVIDSTENAIYVTGYDTPFLTAINMDGSVKWRNSQPDAESYGPYKVNLNYNKIIVTTENTICVYDKSGKLLQLENLSTQANESEIDIRAFSCLVEKSGVYSQYYIVDNDNTTSWVEGVDGSGIGEYIEFYFIENKYTSSSTIRIINGYAKSEELYYSNNRVKKIKIEYGSGGKYSEEHELKDGRLDFQTIELKNPIGYVMKITILDVYKGTKYDDTCISEISIP